MRKILGIWVFVAGLGGFGGCTPELVRRMPPDSLASLRLPPGVWGVVVTQDTVFAGSLLVDLRRVRVDTRNISFPRIRCLAYLYPPGWRPIRIYGESYLAAGIWAVLGFGFLTAMGAYAVQASRDPAVLLLSPLILNISVSLFMANLTLFQDAVSYPRWLASTPHRFVVTASGEQREDPWVTRCAEILHFYSPLLDQRKSMAIPLEFGGE